MGWLGRAALGVATGGLSEAARAAQDQLDTGKDERDKAQKLDAEARKLWTDEYGNVPTADSMQMSYGRGGDVNPYETGGHFTPFEEHDINAGNSAYDDVKIDPRARSQMKGASDYFAGVMKNPIDAMAEADYSRRQKQAEMQRRASADSALANLEARGQGNSGANLTAALSSSSGQISDQYQAGLDTNAIAQARRDSAATSYGQAGEHIGDMKLRADQAKAEGQDAWNEWNVGKRYDTQQRNVEAKNKEATAAQSRDWEVGDANTALTNETNRWNRLGAPAQVFQDHMAVTSGATGQYAQSAGGMRSDGTNAFNIWKDAIIPFGSNMVKAGAK